MFRPTILQFSVLLFVVLEFVAGTPKWATAKDGRKYLVEWELKYNWLQASDLCARQQMQLVVIDSKAKNDALVSLLKTEFSITDLVSYWIGHHDEFSEEINLKRPFYAASTGAKLSFTNWRDGEPNNKKATESCVHMYKNYRWNDVHCTNLAGYVCEEHYLVTKHHNDLEQKRLSANRMNTEISRDFSERQNSIEQIHRNTQTANDNIFVMLKQSMEEIIENTEHSINDVVREKPYMEAVMADLKASLNIIVADMHEGLSRVSDDARQTSEDLHVKAAVMTGDVTSEFGVKLANNKKDIDTLLAN